MVKGISTLKEFENATTDKKSNRRLFNTLDQALKAVDAAEILADQISAVESLLEKLQAYTVKQTQELGNIPRNSPAWRRRHFLTVQQITKQAKEALVGLHAERTERFEKAAARLSDERRQEKVVSIRSGDGPIRSEQLFEFMMLKVGSATELQKVLERLQAGQHGWMLQPAIVRVLDKTVTQKEMSWFSPFVLKAMLVPPDGSTDSLLACEKPDTAERELLRCLTPMVTNRDVAIKLLKDRAGIIIVPRNQYLTALPQFSGLKDVIVRGGGRVWNSTRGVGDVESGGRHFLACTEENLLGSSVADNILKHVIEKTLACPADHVLDSGSPRYYYTVKSRNQSPSSYDEGYSTTIHEFAHVIHRRALSEKDKQLIETHYKKWSRGMTEEDYATRTWEMPILSDEAEKNRVSMLRQIALRRIERQLRRARVLTEAEREDLVELMQRTLGPKTAKEIKRSLSMGWEWVDGPIGITEQEKERRKKTNKADIEFRKKLSPLQRKVEVEILGKKVQMQETVSIDLPRYFQSIPTDGSPVCYACSHFEEYFAQISTCWLEANGGDDPYTGKPRKNSQEWVRENEPRPITELLERLYGTTTVRNPNPRSNPL